MTADLYGVLGVTPDATVTDLTTAYRRRVRLVHPDAGGDAAAFRAVQSAYTILRDPALRAGYDSEIGVSSPPAAGSGQKPAGAAGSARSSSSAGSSGKRPPSSAESAAAAAGARRAWVEEPAAGSGGAWPSGVMLDRIGWAQPFLQSSDAELRDRVRVWPGRWWWLVRVAVGLGLLAWVLLGFWIGGHRLSQGQVVWALAWLATVAVCSRVVLHRRWPVLPGLAAAALAGQAVDDLGTAWTAAVIGWVAVMVAAVPAVRATTGRRLISARKARGFNVFGEPRWHSGETGELAVVMTLIPAVRVIHHPGMGSADHAVVLGSRVALIGGAPIPAPSRGCQVRSWPTAVVDQPHRAVTELGEWLLSDQDPFVVDRRVLSEVFTGT